MYLIEWLIFIIGIVIDVQSDTCEEVLVMLAD